MRDKVARDVRDGCWRLEACVKAEESGEGELKEVKLPLGVYMLGEAVEYKAVIENGKLWIKAGEETGCNDYWFGRFAEWEKARQEAMARQRDIGRRGRCDAGYSMLEAR